jgi:hypothetical protein
MSYTFKGVDFEQAYSIGDDDSLQKQGQHLSLVRRKFWRKRYSRILENSITVQEAYLVLTAGIITDSETEAEEHISHNQFIL